jgi:hypothetical protein
MKTRIFKQASVIALMVVAALTVTFSIVSGQHAEENQSSSSSNARERTIEGVWRTQITPRDCQTGVPLLPFTIPGLITYHKGGTMSETAVAPGGPASRTPGHGVWNRRNRRHYNSSFVFQLFNPDGTFAGTQRVNQNFRLNASGDRWEDNATFQIFDANDNVIVTGCATAVGTRFE